MIPEINRTQCHQVGGQAGVLHQDETEEQGQWNDYGNDQCAWDVQKHGGQNDYHQSAAEEQNFFYGLDCLIDEFCLIVIRDDLNPGRKVMRCNLLDLLLDPFDNRLGVDAFSLCRRCPLPTSTLRRSWTQSRDEMLVRPPLGLPDRQLRECR